MNLLEMIALMNPEALYGMNEKLERKIRINKPMRKCLLKGCNAKTSHNGGYCCAEHCRQDKKKGGGE